MHTVSSLHKESLNLLLLLYLDTFAWHQIYIKTCFGITGLIQTEIRHADSLYSSHVNVTIEQTAPFHWLNTCSVLRKNLNSGLRPKLKDHAGVCFCMF